MQLGYLYVRESLADQSVPKRLLYFILAMDDKKLFYLFWVLAGEELAKVLIISVGAHAANAADLGIDLMQHAKDMYLLGPGHQTATQRMRFAIAYHEYCITGILDVVADMMFDP